MSSQKINYIINNAIDKNTNKKQIDMLSSAQKQELIELFTVPKKTKYWAKQTAYTDNFVFQADVLKLPTSIGAQKFLLVIIDLFDKNIDFQALKNITGKSIKSAFVAINKREYIDLDNAFVLSTDGGPEFKNKTVKEYLKSKKIKHKINLRNRHSQTGTVEKYNAILSEILGILMRIKELADNRKSKVWTTFLPGLRILMNDKYSKKPRQISIDNIEYIYQEKHHMLRVGDSVRIQLDYPVDFITGKAETVASFRRADQRFSKKVYKIKQILMLPNAPIRYIVAVDITKNKIQDVAFYKNQLLKITNK